MVTARSQAMSQFFLLAISNLQLKRNLGETECETECSTFYRTDYIGARRSAVNTMIDGAIAEAKDGFEVCTGKRSTRRIVWVQTRHLEHENFREKEDAGKKSLGSSRST
jgi:hypothetical protein